MKTATIVRFDQSKPQKEVGGIKIDVDVPLPVKRNTRNTPFRDAMRALEVGHSFVFPNPETKATTVHTSVTRMVKHDLVLKGRVFTARAFKEETEKEGVWIDRVRIWRTK